MLKKRLLMLLVFLIPAFSFADYEHFWAEISGGLGGGGLRLKARDGSSGWALSYSNFQPLDFFTTQRDRSTGEIVYPELHVVSATKTWLTPTRRGYVDYGVGLGYGHGSWIDDCKDKVTSEGFTVNVELCDYHEGNRLGIPFHASKVLGNGLGIGLSVSGFLHQDDVPVQFTLVYSFGNFKD